MGTDHSRQRRGEPAAAGSWQLQWIPMIGCPLPAVVSVIRCQLLGAARAKGTPRARAERLRLLEVRQMPGLLDDGQLRFGDAGVQAASDVDGDDLVLGADDDERGTRDAARAVASSRAVTSGLNRAANPLHRLRHHEFLHTPNDVRPRGSRRRTEQTWQHALAHGGRAALGQASPPSGPGPRAPLRRRLQRAYRRARGRRHAPAPAAARANAT